ncbi:MAG: AtpZ/AtpI family protein [Saprospiraceae bacterium]|jgi:F0F1-type ATP synthase assembly protein I|nr:AtpZ/AtpI family protein [Saprospiraceae bacterium]
MLDKKPLKTKSTGTVVLRFSGMAFEMLATILVGWWLGKKLDVLLSFKKPLFAVLFILLFTILSLYRVIKSLEKLNK